MTKTLLDGTCNDNRANGRLLSEKLDGLHVIHNGNGEIFNRKTQKRIPLPPFFTKGLVASGIPIEGELWYLVDIQQLTEGLEEAS